jgi:type II secretory pathway component PulM
MVYARSITTAWDTAPPAQRVLFCAFIAVLAVVLGVFYVAMPLREAIARAKSDVERNRMVLDIARARATENASLARDSPPVHAGEPALAIDRVLSRHGLQFAPSGSKSAEGGRLSIVVARARFDALVGALEALARDEGIHVVEATVMALVDPGFVRAELSFRR